MEMIELLKLEDKLNKMSAQELYAYANKNYPDVENVGLGKKKLVVRKIVNLERDKMNKEDSTE